MPSWSHVTATAPELARTVRSRFDLHGLALMATLRRDGWPRISGIEPLFTDRELWLGMMDRSRKVADLLRDPRLALRAATSDKEVADGDAKLSGRATAVEDKEGIARFRADFQASMGYAPPDGPMHVFAVDVTEMSMLRPAGDHLIIEWWREGEAPHRVERQ